MEAVIVHRSIGRSGSRVESGEAETPGVIDAGYKGTSIGDWRLNRSWDYFMIPGMYCTGTRATARRAC